jgi:hypothetical protein
MSSGNPAVNTPLISQRLGSWDIINVQEDFNYDAALYANDSHTHRTEPADGSGEKYLSRTQLTKPAYILRSSKPGLNSLSNYEFSDMERVAWNVCNPTGNCKGFTFLRTQASDGLWADVYNLHSNEGSQTADTSARQSNFQQLANFISERSVGFPVVVMGNTNSRYTNNGDSSSLHSLLESAGLTDTWVNITQNGDFPQAGSESLDCVFPFSNGTSQRNMDKCEVADKIFIRGGIAATLTPETYTNENLQFLNETGSPLSDRYPVSSTLDWTLSSSLRMSGSKGGPHGYPFTDLASVISSEENVPSMTSFTLRGGRRLDAVSYAFSFWDGSSQTVAHGGGGGDEYTLDLEGDYITKMSLCQGGRHGRTRIFWAGVETANGQYLSAGEQTEDCAAFSAPTDLSSGGSWGLVGFWGRSGDEVDLLSPIWGAVY